DECCRRYKRYLVCRSGHLCWFRLHTIQDQSAFPRIMRTRCEKMDLDSETPLLSQPVLRSGEEQSFCFSEPVARSAAVPPGVLLKPYRAQASATEPRCLHRCLHRVVFSLSRPRPTTLAR